MNHTRSYADNSKKGVSKIKRNSLGIPSKSSTPGTGGRNIKMDEVASGCIPGDSLSYFRTKH